MRCAPRTALIGFAITLTSILAHASAVAQPSGRAERLTGTVRAVHVQAGTCDLLTGVGHALRVRVIHLPSRMMLRARGVASPVAELTPGSIVRVECRTTPEGTIASRVELLEAPAAAPKR